MTDDLRVTGRWVGDTLYWDIGDETIMDRDLRQWVWQNLPEDSPFRYVDTCILSYHIQAYANRRRAIADFVKTINFTKLHAHELKLQEALHV